jgi:methyl-accepting chemotaxis protein
MKISWSVGTKIAGGFGLALIIMAVIGTVAYRSSSALITNSRWVVHSDEVIINLERLLSLLQDAETGQRGFLLTGAERYLAPYNAARPRVQTATSEIKKLTADNPNQQRRIDALEPLVRSKLSELQETIDLRRQKGFEPAVNVVLTDRGKKVMDDIRSLVGEMEGEERQLLQQRTEESEASAQSTRYTIILGTLTAIVLLGITSSLVTRNIAAPLRQISLAAEAMAAGDLSVNVPSDTRQDEVGVVTRTFARMADSLRDLAKAAERIAAGDLRVTLEPRSEKDVLGKAFAVMTDRLRRITSEMKESVNVLSSSASEILATTTQIAAGATETAAAVSETTTTVEEVKQTTQVSSQKAKYVSETAQKTVQISQAGRKSAEETVEGMNRIREQMESVAESIVRLSEQGQAIGEIIAAVNDIADQSNLLAVNAAIEAAKAGEQGRGFAVVAQEVKSLAAQSKQATAQVRGILGDIQKATSAAAMATEQANKAVESGIKQSMQAGDAVQRLAESIAEAAQAAVQIAASAQQQQVGMDQVALAMENIKQASNQNAASTKQAEVSAQSLHALGQKLEDLVEQFQV